MQLAKLAWPIRLLPPVLLECTGPWGCFPHPNHCFSYHSIQPLSQPGSPAPGPPAQMDLEHPPQPTFGTPTSLLKKEPPGYEEAVNQQPRQQMKKVD